MTGWYHPMILIALQNFDMKNYGQLMLMMFMATMASSDATLAI